MSIHCIRWFLLVGLAVAGLAAADQGLPTRSPLTPPTPVLSLVAYAAGHHIPLEGLAPSGDGVVPRKGDQVTLLLSLEKGGITRQWLVRLTADDLNARESARPPPPEEVIYTTTGQVLRYPNTLTALDVECTGPFGPGAEQPSVSTGQARTLVAREYLNLGIGRYCESALQIVPRLQAAGIGSPKYYGGGSAPSGPEIAEGRLAAAAYGLTPEEERVAFSVYFAVRSFFEAAMGIPACKEVLEQVIQKPSVWSVIGRLGVNSNFRYGWQEVSRVDGGVAGLAQTVHLLPLRVSLNNTLAVNATLAVTEPRPPLQACAGILALCAEHPTLADRRLFIRVLSARRAGG